MRTLLWFSVAALLLACAPDVGARDARVPDASTEDAMMFDVATDNAAETSVVADASDAGGRCTPNAGAMPGTMRSMLSRDITVFARYPVGATGALPVVLIEHGGGLGANPASSMECWGRTLARAGFVVLHVGHPYPPGCSAMGCAGGTFLQSLCTAYGITDCGPGMEVIGLVRSLDLRAVLDDLDCIEADLQSRTGSSFTLDRNRIGGLGWSGGTRSLSVLGGAASMITRSTRFVLPDARLKAILTNSPSPPGDGGWFCTPNNNTCCVDGTGCAGWESMSSWAGLRIPLMVHTGDGDCSDGGEKVGPWRRATYDGAGAMNRALLYLDHPSCNGTVNQACNTNGCFFTHESFSLDGDASCNADGTLIAPMQGNMASVVRFGVSRLLLSSARAFFDATLNARTEARSYLASDRLELLSSGYVNWPGDAALNGTCSASNVADCEYRPATTYAVREVTAPYTVRVTRY